MVLGTRLMQLQAKASENYEDYNLTMFSRTDCEPCDEIKKAWGPAIDSGNMVVRECDPDAAPDTEAFRNYQEAVLMGQDEFPFAVNEGKVCTFLKDGSLDCPD